MWQRHGKSDEQGEDGGDGFHCCDLVWLSLLWPLFCKGKVNLLGWEPAKGVYRVGQRQM